jgi:hypothetical protein
MGFASFCKIFAVILMESEKFFFSLKILKNGIRQTNELRLLESLLFIITDMSHYHSPSGVGFLQMLPALQERKSLFRA